MKFFRTTSQAMSFPEFNTPPNCEALDAVIETLMTAIEARDMKLRRHSERVADFADQIAATMDLNAMNRQILRWGCLLHDIGNIGIPDSILLKPTGLTAWEFDEMKLHTIIGEQICRSIVALTPALPLIRSHHEKLDGSGYPNQLKNDEISLAVRILSVCDVYDTLRIERVYRDAFTHGQALDILRREVERGWWDAQVVEHLESVVAHQSSFAAV